MKRHPQWETRLHELIVANRNRAYAFGQCDCLLWPAAAARAVTGKDFARGHKGKYKSFASAYRYLKQIGFDSPSAMIDSLFSVKPIGFAGNGDIVLCHTPTGDNPGVVIGSHALVVGEDSENVGLVRVPRDQWLKAWAVGDHHSGDMR